MQLLNNNSKHTISILLIVCLLLTFFKVNGQYNLVPNYSFEDSVKCPKIGDNPLPKPWYNPTNYQGGAYVNACALDTLASVPYNYYCYAQTYQPARTGNGYAAILPKTDGYNYRIYIQIKLKDSLQLNKSYYCEFWVSLPNLSKKACNNISLLLTKSKIYSDTIADPTGLRIIPANPQIINYSNPIVTDTLNWVKISGVYIAKGGESFLTIGNFKTDSVTDIKVVNPNACDYLSYFIDDVSVIPLDSFCLKADAGRDTTIKIGDSAFIGSYTNGIDTIKWYNSSGQLIDSIRPGFWYTPNIAGTNFFVLRQTVNGCFSSDTVYINAVLPLTFINYELQLTNRTIQQQPQTPNTKQIINIWQTANEINVSHYNIQRSTNGKDFATIGTVKAHNKNYNQYAYTNKSTRNEKQETWYYRIEAIDKDGSKQYSTTQQITIKPQTPNSVSIYPNPANDILNIECKDGIKQIKIIDMFGREVFRQTKNESSVQRQTINLNGFNKGFYVIELVLKYGNSINEKLVVE